MPEQRPRQLVTSLLLAGACLSLALARPPAAHAQAIDLTALEGNWVRIGSNYDPNDQMRIRVSGDQATLMRVPTTVHSGFRVGQRLWMGIASDGTVRVRGSDGQYYPGTLKFSGADELTLVVDQSAAGNDQVWRRAGPTVDGEWVRIAPGDAAADGTRVLVDQDQATIRFLAADAPRAYRIGTRLWRGIGAGGVVEVMDGGGRYAAARLRLQGSDTLWVESTGTATPQLWVRPAIAEAARATFRSGDAAPTATHPDTSSGGTSRPSTPWKSEALPNAKSTRPTRSTPRPGSR